MSIPASRIVTINPSAIGTGGNPLAMNTLLISDSEAFINGVIPFGSAAEVGEYFGLTSTEFTFAQRYFLGYDGATRLPGILHIVHSEGEAQSAFLLGGSLKTMTVTQLKAVSGNIKLVANGADVDITIDLAAVTSFSEAADLIGTELSTATTAAYACQFNERMQRFELYSVAGDPTTSTITVATGTAAEPLKLTTDAGAVAQNGADVSGVAGLMSYVMSITQNFGVIAYSTAVDRDRMEAMAEWVTLQNSRFAYIALDTTGSALVANNDASFGRWLSETNQAGTTAYYGTVEQVAAVCGGIAAIDFKRLNGRRNIMFMKQAGLAASVTTESDYTALMSNGYTFYGTFSTANDSFTFNVNGAVSGEFKWLDSYINQIYLNAQLQLAMMTMLTSYGAIPYNERGKAYHRSAALDPINEMVNFGGIVPLIDPNALSEQQKSIINSVVGYDVVPTLLSQGWVIDIKTADAQTRGLRGSMPMTVLYSDGSSIQSVNLASINVQ